MTTQTRVDVSVDWPHAPEGHTDLPIRITAGGDTVTVLAHVSNPPVERIPTNAHVEADGYVAVEARHFQHAVGLGEARWSVIAFGRTGSAVEMFPSTLPAQRLDANTPHLEYRLYLLHAGSVQVQVTTAPSLDFTGGAGLRYAFRSMTRRRGWSTSTPDRLGRRGNVGLPTMPTCRPRRSL